MLGCAGSLMAKIRIQCSECGHEARVPEQFRARKVRCLHCHAKLRVPEDAPLAEPRSPARAIPRRPRGRPRAATESQAMRGGPSSRTRREALTLVRELLHDCDHAVESVPRGFEIDLRGVPFGLARTLVEEMLECQAIRDVKLAGGTGECRITVTLQGWDFDPEDSFAEDDDDTEVFHRPSSALGAAAPAWIDSAVGVEDTADPARQLREDAPDVVPESTLQSFMGRTSEGGDAIEPLRLYERARQRIEDGEPQAAIPLLERAIRADKNFSRAVLMLGKAYASAGDFNRARRAFRHLARLEADDPEAQVLYAAAAVRCDRLDEAKLSLATAIQLDPEYRQAYRYAAQLYERLGEEDKARKFRARYQALKLRG